MREQKCFTIIHALASLPSPISTAYPAPVQLYNTNQPTGSYTQWRELGKVSFYLKLNYNLPYIGNSKQFMHVKILFLVHLREGSLGFTL